MPTPIGHSLSGILIYVLFFKKRPLRDEWRWVLFAAVLAAAPDLDFIPGWFLGNYNEFHRGYSHSVGGGLLVVGFLWLGMRQICDFTYGRLFLFLISLYGSHLALDFFARDTAPPYGAQFLWPFSSDYYISPWTPFLDAHREPPRQIFSQKNLVAYLSEFVYFGLPLLLLSFFRRFSLTRKQETSCVD